MDNLCHSLVGAALAESGLRRRTRYATTALVLGANFPDLDVAAAFTEHGLGFRRGITHGFPALIVLPFVLTAIILAWHAAFRRPKESSPIRPKQLVLLSALAILTHPVLDWMNTYGMRWLMPLDGTWVYADSLFIVDPWLLLMLGAAWLGGRRARVIGPEELRLRGERFARQMIGMSAAYIAGMILLTQVGRVVADRDLGGERRGARQLMVSPPFLESWRRYVTVDAGAGYRFGRIDWWPRPALVLDSAMLPKQTELLQGLPRTVPLDDLLDWGRFIYAQEAGDAVHVDDARYSRGGRSFAGVVVRPGSMGDEEGRRETK
jgi:inner membrane protein